jgi:hypothetical protein
VLKIYDYLVPGFVKPHSQRCPTKTILLPFFAEHAGKTAHLDVGVGIGGYLTHSMHVPAQSTITFADMNLNTLNTAIRRVVQSGCERANIHEIVYDVFTLFPENLKVTRMRYPYSTCIVHLPACRTRLSRCSSI